MDVTFQLACRYAVDSRAREANILLVTNALSQCTKRLLLGFIRDHES
jgi:hypothetical protein